MSLSPYLQYFPEFILGFILSLLLTPIAGVLAKRFDIIDMPGSLRKRDDKTRWRRIHTEPKLKLGGIAVIIPFLLISLIFVQHSKYFWGVFSGASLLFICGLLDDIFDLPASIQALFQIIAAFLVVFSGLQILIISNPFGGHAINLQFWELNIHGVIRYIPAAIITMFWIGFVINAIKWVSGSDGLVEGNGAISAFIIALLSIRFQTYDTAIMGFALSGAFLGLLIFNFYPSKILSSSSGKSVYGFLLAVLAIYAGGKLATFLLTLSLPILDAIWVIIYRIIKNRPKNLVQLLSINDKSHIHFKLMELGFSQRQIAIIEYLYTLFMGSLAFLLTGAHKALTIIFTLLVLILLYIGIAQFIYKRKKETKEM